MATFGLLKHWTVQTARGISWNFFSWFTFIPIDSVQQRVRKEHAGFLATLLWLHSQNKCSFSWRSSFLNLNNYSEIRQERVTESFDILIGNLWTWGYYKLHNNNAFFFLVAQWRVPLLSYIEQASAIWIYKIWYSS